MGFFLPKCLQTPQSCHPCSSPSPQRLSVLPSLHCSHRSLPVAAYFREILGNQTKVFAGLQCSKDVFIKIHPVPYQPPQWTVPPISAFLPPRQCWVEHHRHQFKSLSCNPRALTRLIPEHQCPCICQARERSLYNKYQLTIHCQRPLLLLAGCPQLPLNYLHTILYLHPRLDVWKVEPWPNVLLVAQHSNSRGGIGLAPAGWFNMALLITFMTRCIPGWTQWLPDRLSRIGFVSRSLAEHASFLGVAGSVEVILLIPSWLANDYWSFFLLSLLCTKITVFSSLSGRQITCRAGCLYQQIPS